MSATDHTTLGELIALFTGVEHEDGGWETTPCYTIGLAAAIASQIEPGSEIALRKHLYGERPSDNIDTQAIYILGLGYQRYRQARDATRNRGL